MVEKLKGKIIRPRYNTTLGISVKHIEHAYWDKYKLTVQYFSTDRSLGMDEKDTLYLTPDQLLEGFEVLYNAPYIKDFKQGKWKLLKKFGKRTDKNI